MRKTPSLLLFYYTIEICQCQQNGNTHQTGMPADMLWHRKTRDLFLPEGKKMNLRKIRKEKGYSVPKLSALADVPVRTIENIEKRNQCTVANAIKLADALGVTLDALCRDDTDKNE